MRKSTLFIFFLFFIFAAWLHIHTFSYDPTRHTFGMARRVWSDLGQHIPMIRSFSMGSNWFTLENSKNFSGPQFPLFPGEPIRYHFLFYFFVGILEKIGLRIDWALNIPSIAGFFLLMTGIFLLAKKLFKSECVALLSIIFFLFNGSLSFLYFFQKIPLSVHTLQAIVAANNFPAFAPWDNTEVTAFWNLNIYTNQRHLALAFGIAVFFLLFLISLRPRLESARRGLADFVFAILFGILFGLFPYFHQPTLVIVAVCEAVYFLLFPKLRASVLVSGLVTLMLVLPQLGTLTHGPDTIVWYPGYLIHDTLSLTHFFRFWWLNLGLHSLFIPLGFLLAPREVRKFFVPIFVIFVFANLFKVSIEVAASHKFFNFALILGNMLTAYALVRLWSSVKFVKYIKYIIVIVFFVVLTLSGIIDFFVVANDVKGEISDIPANKTAAWIAANTPKDAVFLNSSFLYHPASIAGRNIFLGWPYFAWSEGYDTDTRLTIMRAMYNTTEMGSLCKLLKTNNIQFVTFQDRNTAEEITFREETFRASFPLVFSNNAEGYRIYDVATVCQ